MEKIETNTQKDGIEETENLALSPRMEEYLQSIGKWGMLLSILGFIMIFFMLACAIYFIAVSAVMYRYVEFGFKFSLLSSTYLILLSVVYFFPTYFLFKFSAHVKYAMKNNDQENLDKSFKDLKRTFKFFGILSIAVITFSIAAIAAFLYIATNLTAPVA